MNWKFWFFGRANKNCRELQQSSQEQSTSKVEIDYDKLAEAIDKIQQVKEAQSINELHNLETWLKRRSCAIFTMSQIVSCILIFVFGVFCASFIYQTIEKSEYFVGGTLILASALAILYAVFEFKDNKKRKEELRNATNINVHIGVIATATALVMMLCTILALIPDVPDIVGTLMELMNTTPSDTSTIPTTLPHNIAG